jgi:L-histidine Nalpha-methyltransferase
MTYTRCGRGLPRSTMREPDRQHSPLVSVPAPRRMTLRRSATAEDPFAFAASVREGLAHAVKHLHCAWFYDEEGSRLFEEICALPEYYLTRAEERILRRHAGSIVSGLPERAELVELGSGSAAKTRILIEELLARNGHLRYVPIDIAHGMLERSSRALLEEYPLLEIHALAAEYQEGLEALAREAPTPRLVLWLGSNVGNFERPAAAQFLGRLAKHLLPGDRILVGIDLRKERETLERAYDDSLGVTARFNKNLLARINRELGGHFDLASFRHGARYDEHLGRIEMYLVSAKAQRVPITALGMEVEFAEGETIHTENSYKYSLEEIAELAQAAGLVPDQQWFDTRRAFSLNRFAPRPVT